MKILALVLTLPLMGAEFAEEKCMEKLLKREPGQICAKEVDALFKGSLATLGNMEFLGHRSYSTVIDKKKGIISLARVRLKQGNKLLTLVYKFHTDTSKRFFLFKKCTLKHIREKTPTSFSTSLRAENDFLEDLFCPYARLDDHIPMDSPKRIAALR